MLDPTPMEAYFSRLGATGDMAEELAQEFDSVAAFLETPFIEKLETVVGKKQARTIASKYTDFEHMRDVGACRSFRALDGVGAKSAMRIDYSYIRRTISTPRDVITAEELARKMGFSTVRINQEQRTLDEVEI